MGKKLQIRDFSHVRENILETLKELENYWTTRGLNYRILLSPFTQ